MVQDAALVVICVGTVVELVGIVSFALTKDCSPSRNVNFLRAGVRRVAILGPFPHGAGSVGRGAVLEVCSV